MSSTKIGEFESGYACVKRDGLWGIIDKAANVVIPCLYQGLGGDLSASSKSLSRYGVIPAKLDGKWGIIDSNNNVVTPFKYNRIHGFSDGVARFDNGKKFGFIDVKGNEVVPLLYYDLFRCSLNMKYGYAVCAKPVNGKWKYGYINRYGEEITPFIFDEAWNFRPLTKEIESSVNESLSEANFSVTLTPRDILNCKSLTEFIDLAFTREKALPNVSSPNANMGIDIDRQIELEMQRWEQKDEFETTTQWKERTNEKAKLERIASLRQKMEDEMQSHRDGQHQLEERYSILRSGYAPELSKIYYKQLEDNFKLQPINIGMYNADNETFTLTIPTYGTFSLTVPLIEARRFKSSWDNYKSSATPIFNEDNDQTTITRIEFAYGSKKYTASPTH